MFGRGKKKAQEQAETAYTSWKQLQTQYEAEINKLATKVSNVIEGHGRLDVAKFNEKLKGLKTGSLEMVEGYSITWRAGKDSPFELLKQAFEFASQVAKTLPRDDKGIESERFISLTAEKRFLKDVAQRVYENVFGEKIQSYDDSLLKSYKVFLDKCADDAHIHQKLIEPCLAIRSAQDPISLDYAFALLHFRLLQIPKQGQNLVAEISKHFGEKGMMLASTPSTTNEVAYMKKFDDLYHVAQGVQLEQKIGPPPAYREPKGAPSAPDPNFEPTPAIEAKQQEPPPYSESTTAQDYSYAENPDATPPAPDTPPPPYVEPSTTSTAEIKANEDKQNAPGLGSFFDRPRRASAENQQPAPANESPNENQDDENEEDRQPVVIHIKGPKA